MSRPGGGAYDDHDPNMILKKAMSMLRQKAMLPPYVKRTAPEIENLPFQAFGKSPAGTAMESSLYFATGHTDMSYSMLMHLNEPMAWHGRELALFAKHRPYWERLSAENLQSYGAGIRYYQTKSTWKKELGAGEGFEEWNDEPRYELLDLTRDAVPYTYDGAESTLFFLCPETAKCLGAEEVEELLGHAVITDGESIDILQKRGFDFGLSCHALEGEYGKSLYERFCEHAVKPRERTEFLASYYGRGRKIKYAVEKTADMELVALYASNNSRLAPLCEDASAPFGVAECIYSTKKGAKWAILGYEPWRGNIPACKRDMMLDIADYISGNALPARVLSPEPFALFPRRCADGRVSAVSMLNCTVGRSPEAELLIRNPVSEKFTFMSQYNGERELTFEKRGEDYILRLPEIDAWSVATVFCR